MRFFCLLVNLTLCALNVAAYIAFGSLLNLAAAIITAGIAAFVVVVVE